MSLVMDCKTTSIKARSAGATLIEVMISAGLASVVFAAICSFSFFSGRSFAALANYVDLDFASRKTLDRMSKEIRQVNRLVGGGDNILIFLDYDNHYLYYYYSYGSKQVMRYKDGKFETMLNECNYLKFSQFQRNPVGGQYDQYPSATPETCKVVQLNWVCSRKIFGKSVNTESVQSAKIVIRNQ